MSGDLVIADARGCTVDWAERVISRHGLRHRVSSVEVVAVELGTTTRIRLQVGHDQPHLPNRWFVKLPSRRLRPRLITALARILHTEARFYRELAPGVGVKVPQMLAAETSLLGSTLVLGDLVESGATPMALATALSSEQVNAMVSQLAVMHAAFWQHDQLTRELEWLAGGVRATENRLGSILSVPLTVRGLKRASGCVDKVLGEAAIDYARQRKQIMRILEQAPRTLVHHDCYPGNWFWDDEGPGLLDWQLVRVGQGIGDVAYLLATGMDSETRRSHELGVLEVYRNALERQGVTDLDAEEMQRRYVLHLSYAFEAMLITLAIGDLMPVDVNLELLSRAACAVRDHEAFERLRASSDI